MTGKLGTDLQKSTDKITAAVNDGAKDLSDSVKRAATTNANQTPPNAASMVATGLESVSDATAKLANHLRSHPTELSEVAGSAEAVGRQFNDLVRSTKEFAQGSERLRGTTTEVMQAAGWINSNYPTGEGNQSVAVGNAFLELWSD
jgi:methyl-accepting chemotaxis protein